MTLRCTVRFVRRMPGGDWRIALQDESNHMRDYIWVKTRSQWLATLAERYMVHTGRPTITAIYNEETRELEGAGL